MVYLLYAMILPLNKFIDVQRIPQRISLSEREKDRKKIKAEIMRKLEE